MPGRPAAIEQSTMPQTIATPKAYACSQPRMRGLPMSAGFSRLAVFVFMAQGYGTVGYLAVVTSATEDFPVVNVRLVGADAVLIEVDDGDPLALHADLWRRREAGELDATDIVPGARTVLVDGVPDPSSLAESLRTWEPADAIAATPDRLVEIAVTFDGPDLDAVAQRWHADVARTIRDTSFRVAFSGFAPGFAYLSGLPPELAVPRLDTPRSEVPAG